MDENMGIPKGADPSRFKAIQGMLESSSPKNGNMGNQENEQDGQLCFDVNQFPELRGKKEGDVATVNIKVEKIEGTNVYASPNNEQQAKEDSAMEKAPMPEDNNPKPESQAVPA